MRYFQAKKRVISNLKSSFGELKTEGFNFDLIKRYHLQKKIHVLFKFFPNKVVST